jgi:hypothetical protein
MVDRFYLNALEGNALSKPALDEARACPDLATLMHWQEISDTWPVSDVESLAEGDLAAIVQVERGERVQQDRRDDL